jgi:hypothetical protein
MELSEQGCGETRLSEDQYQMVKDHLDKVFDNKEKFVDPKGYYNPTSWLCGLGTPGGSC